MQLNEALSLIEKNLKEINEKNGFRKAKNQKDNAIVFESKTGVYRIFIDEKSSLALFECSFENHGEKTEFATISKSLFDLSVADDRDVRSCCNEFSEEIESTFGKEKKRNIDNIKIPKSVSRTKAKNGTVSYDADSLANRFANLYPELKTEIKENIAKYGEFLPEDFFMNHGTPRVLETIKNGTDEERKKLFKALNDIYEDGTNEVQDIIGVTILGEMKNDKEMMAIADEYMSEYMSGPVHEINKITAKNGRLVKKLKNPPAYKPKKKSPYQLALEGQAAQQK